MPSVPIWSAFWILDMHSQKNIIAKNFTPLKLGKGSNIQWLLFGPNTSVWYIHSRLIWMIDEPISSILLHQSYVKTAKHYTTHNNVTISRAGQTHVVIFGYISTCSFTVIACCRQFRYGHCSSVQFWLGLSYWRILWVPIWMKANIPFHL